jgi:hypothetical protein
MHLKIPEFDFYNGIFFVNVAEGKHRSWDDCIKYGFLAAGNGRNWSEQLDRLNPGDVVAAYLRKNGEGGGYAGVGVVAARAVRVNQFRIKGRPLLKRNLKACSRMSLIPHWPNSSSQWIGGRHSLGPKQSFVEMPACTRLNALSLHWPTDVRHENSLRRLSSCRWTISRKVAGGKPGLIGLPAAELGGLDLLQIGRELFHFSFLDGEFVG